MSNTNTNRKIVTPEGWLSYPSLVVPEDFEDNDKKDYDTYGASIIFPDDIDPRELDELYDLADDVICDKYGSVKKTPSKFNYPIRDCDEDPERKEKAGFNKGCHFLKATNYSPIRCFDERKREIKDEDEILKLFYGGCLVRFQVKASLYNNKSVGCKFKLLGVQFIQDDEPFGDTADADLFDEVPVKRKIESRDDRREDRGRGRRDDGGSRRGSRGRDNDERGHDDEPKDWDDRTPQDEPEEGNRRSSRRSNSGGDNRSSDSDSGGGRGRDRSRSDRGSSGRSGRDERVDERSSRSSRSDRRRDDDDEEIPF